MERIRIGQYYMAKLSKRTTAVRVESTHPDGGWLARCLDSGRTTRVAFVSQFQRLCTDDEVESANGTPTPQRGRAAPAEPETPVPTPEKMSLLDAPPRRC